LPVSLERRLEAGIEVGDHKTSMLQDLEVGKPLEVDCLTGAVVELARKLGLAVPRVETLHACVKLLARCETRHAVRVSESRLLVR
jgi:2-dehydropantoate 2-reductase